MLLKTLSDGSVCLCVRFSLNVNSLPAITEVKEGCLYGSFLYHRASVKLPPMMAQASGGYYERSMLLTSWSNYSLCFPRKGVVLLVPFSGA